MTPVVRLARIVLNTADASALARFYRDALGFEIGMARDRVVALRLGATRIDLHQVDGSGYPDDVAGWDPRFQHCAIVVPGMAVAMSRLNACVDWTAISLAGPERLPPNTGGVVAFKFRDPEGHPLELLWVPGATDATPRVDHTALSVQDVERSIAYYADLGWVATGRSHNAGAAQARLDAIPDAEVDVVTLTRPGAPGPHLELLGYRGDRDRPVALPAIDDIAATRMVFTIPRAATRPPTTRDPDGHFIAFEDDDDDRPIG